MCRMHHIVAKSGVIAIVSFVGIILDEKTGIPIAAAVAIAAAWGSGLWWLGRKLQSLEDGQKLTRLEYKSVIDRLNHLACQKPGSEDTCPHGK